MFLCGHLFLQAEHCDGVSSSAVCKYSMSFGNVHPKISREFSVRLGRLNPRDKVRAIVMLRPEANGMARTRRPSRSERQSAANWAKQSAEAALPLIDQILERYDGHRLAEHPDLLGTIHVETTADGVFALADSDCVKAIMEDQNILPNKTSNS